jgi:hypothetical protein
VIVVWVDPALVLGGRRVMWARIRRVGHGWGAKKRIADVTYGSSPSFAMNARGDASVVWEDKRGIEIASHPPGGGWRKPHTVSDRNSAKIAFEAAPVALGARGDGMSSGKAARTSRLSGTHRCSRDFVLEAATDRCGSRSGRKQAYEQAITSAANRQTTRERSHFGVCAANPASRHEPTGVRAYPQISRWIARPAATAEDVPKLPQTATFCYAQPSGSGLVAPLKIVVSPVRIRSRHRRIFVSTSAQALTDPGFGARSPRGGRRGEPRNRCRRTWRLAADRRHRAGFTEAAWRVSSNEILEGGPPWQ